MNQKDFAQVVTDAYFSHYRCDSAGQNHGRVMNYPIITYNFATKRFSWQSSLTPLYEEEIIVLDLTPETFGGEEPAETREEMVKWLENDDEFLWPDIKDRIEN